MGVYEVVSFLFTKKTLRSDLLGTMTRAEMMRGDAMKWAGRKLHGSFGGLPGKVFTVAEAGRDPCFFIAQSR